jgi:PKD repeat protein
MRMLLVFGTLVLCSFSTNGQIAVPMSQYNFERTGANLEERILSPANVDPARFGKLFSRSVDDTVYALPLIVPNLELGGQRRNVLYVATMSNTVYAFDADDSAKTQPYWSRNLGTPSLAGSTWIGPVNHGILGTPFIDLTGGALYVVALVRNGTDRNLWVHALDIQTGNPKYNSPQLLSFPFAGSASQTNVPGGLQRAGLLVMNDVLYIAFANIVPTGMDQHWWQEGFVQSFNARDLSQRMGVFQTTPTGQKGGIWQAGRGIATDGSAIYIATAGGDYDGVTNYGSSAVKLSAGNLNVLDWFAPINHRDLFLKNIDLSANGITLIPNSFLMYAGGKEGVIYLMNRNGLGGLENPPTVPLQRFQASAGCGLTDCAQTLGTAFWRRQTDGVLYVWDRGDSLKAYNFVSDRFVTTAASVNAVKRPMTGGPAVSANGSDLASGIVWAVTMEVNDSGAQAPGTLRAFRATDVSQEIYNSDVNKSRDAVGNFTKFAPPVVANGKVYVPTHSNSVSVYGLLCANNVSPLVSTERGTLNAGASDTYTQSLTVTNTAPYALGAPFDVVLDNLTFGVALKTATGETSCAAPAGSPLVRAMSAPLWLAPGAAFTVTLEFTAASSDIGFNVRVLNGSIDRPNQPPTASFTYTCTGLTCSFNASTSVDSDGTVIGYAWDFGDGGSGLGVSASRTYSTAGTYTVGLRVTDNSGGTGTTSKTVTVTASPANIVLNVKGYKVRAQMKADLTWSGATSGSVDVYRNGAAIVRTANNGFYTDSIAKKGSYQYRVCEAGGNVCSNAVTIKF